MTTWAIICVGTINNHGRYCGTSRRVRAAGITRRRYIGGWCKNKQVGRKKTTQQQNVFEIITKLTMTYRRLRVFGAHGEYLTPFYRLKTAASSLALLAGRMKLRRQCYRPSVDQKRNCTILTPPFFREKCAHSVFHFSAVGIPELLWLFWSSSTKLLNIFMIL